MQPDNPARSKKLSRQLARHSGSDSHQANVDMSIQSLTDLGDFLDAIDKSYAEYEDKIKFISRSLELSSQELNVSNRRLEILNDAVNTMLNSLGQGLVFFDSEAVCSDVCSKACESLLDQIPSDKKIYDVLNLSSSQLENFMSWLQIVYSTHAALSFEDLAELAPDHFINSRKQFVELTYRPVYDYVGKLSAVLLIATDKTFEKTAAQTLRETETLSRTIVSISNNRNEFSDFMRNIKSFLSDLYHRDAHDPLEVIREFHTYKGLALHFGLESIGAAFHEAEGVVKDSAGMTMAEYKSIAAPIEVEIEEAHILAKNILGKDYLDRGLVRSINVSDLMDLRDQLAPIQGERIDEIKKFIDSRLLGVPSQECFSVFESEVIRLASLQGKPLPEIKYHTQVTSINFSDYRTFFESLIHLARNIMDHGIEAASVRRKAGKPPQGSVDIFVSRIEDQQGAHILFSICDDGQGLNPPHLRERLSHLALYDGDVATLSDYDVIQFIFHPNFSSRSSVTALSGRGVGMYAIKKAVQDLSGVYEVLAQDRGTRFNFKLPL